MKAALVGAVLAIAATRAHAQPESMSVDPGVVVVPAAKRIYLMDPKDGVVALDLATGKRLWAAKQLAAKPFAARGHAVVALDEAGSVRVLDGRTGKLARPCSLVPGIRLDLRDGLGLSQYSVGVSDGKRVFVTWSRATHYAGGAVPTPAQQRAASSRAGGVFEIDVTRCTAAEGTDPFTSVNGHHTTPAGTRFTLDAVKLVVSRDGKPAIDLRAGHANRHQVVISADRRHVMVGEHDPKGSIVGSYAVEIHDIDTGSRVATLPLLAFPSSFLVIGRRLVSGSRGVSVHDLDKQRQVWGRAARITAYTGPYPPSAPPRR